MRRHELAESQHNPHEPPHRSRNRLLGHDNHFADHAEVIVQRAKIIVSSGRRESYAEARRREKGKLRHRNTTGIALEGCEDKSRMHVLPRSRDGSVKRAIRIYPYLAPRVGTARRIKEVRRLSAEGDRMPYDRIPIRPLDRVACMDLNPSFDEANDGE